MITKKIIFFVVGCFLLIGVIYLIVMSFFTYAYRDFSGSDSWRHLKEYNCNEKKQVIEQRIYELEKNNSSVISLKENYSALSGNRWITLFIMIPSDTIEYFYHFAGDTAMWNEQPNSRILLMEMKNKQHDIKYTTLKTADKKAVKKMMYLFESMVIDSLKAPKSN